MWITITLKPGFLIWGALTPKRCETAFQEVREKCYYKFYRIKLWFSSDEMLIEILLTYHWTRTKYLEGCGPKKTLGTTTLNYPIKPLRFQSSGQIHSLLKRKHNVVYEPQLHIEYTIMNLHWKQKKLLNEKDCREEPPSLYLRFLRTVEQKIVINALNDNPL